MDSRQQRQAYPQRPPYPQAQPATSPSASSVFQSTSSMASLSSLNTTNMPAQSAPLPSPSVHQPGSYFSSIAAPAGHPPQQRIPQQQQMLSPYVGQRNGGGAPETTPLLQDFSLIAEAAKRAQIATLSRDLGDIGL